MSGERWNLAYREAPEVFDDFCRAEDPEGRITRCLKAHAGLAGKKVLEIGCGTGRYSGEGSESVAHYVGVDRHLAMLALTRNDPSPRTRDVDFLCADATRLPFADGTFDRVLAGWVVVNLRQEARRAVLGEAARVLRPDADSRIWLVENHWGGDFQNLRGRRAEVEEARIERLRKDWGFEIVEVVETELRFPTTEEAVRNLGWLCGDRVKRRLEENPTTRIGHHVVILRGPLTSSRE